MINPTWSLRDVFGAGVAFDPAACFVETGWLPSDRASLDALTGNQITLARTTPIICHRDAATPGILRLFADVGHQHPEHVLTYATASDYRTVLEELTRGGWRIAVTHAHAPLVLGDEHLWIPVAVLRELNDKGNVHRLAPEHAVPPRRRLPAAEFAALDHVKLPVVAKVSAPQSSGAGYGVRICHTAGQFRQAQVDLARAPAVVLEAWLPIVSSWCVQCVVTPAGALALLGAAEQVCGPDGSWHGNWVVAGVPDAVVQLGTAVVAAGAARGYRGIAGIDIAQCDDGRLWVLDTNYRFNGSTVALLYREALAARGARVLRSRPWTFKGPFDAMADRVRRLCAAGRFLPTGAWDPQEGAPRVTGVAIGSTREDVAGILADMERAGFR